MTLLHSVVCPTFAARPSGNTHGTLSFAMARLATSPDERFAAGFGALVAALECAFREEEATMERIGIPMPQHLEQHRRAQHALHRCESRVQRGDIAAGRETLQRLEHWFLVHQETMDAVLASVVELCAGAPPRPHARAVGAGLARFA